jgi:hypothetical protein
MLFLNRPLAVHSYVVAVFSAIAVPMLLGYLIYNANPSACYDSPCLLPLLLMIVPPYAAPVLAVLFAINRRRKKLVPDGWLPTILFSGFVGQIAISVFAVSMSPPELRDIFFSDLLSVPQGLIVGLTVGGVFWVSLTAFARVSTRI